MTRRILVVLFLCSPVVFAADTPPSEASIRQLLDVMQAQKNVDAIMGQMDSIMKSAFEQATAGQTVSPEAQKSFEKCRTDIVTMFKEQFTWTKLAPMYIRIYQKSFTQDEVNGMIGFYKTPAGQSVISKLPLVMQNSMNETMTMMGPMIERVKAMQKEVATQMRSSKEKKGGS